MTKTMNSIMTASLLAALSAPSARDLFSYGVDNLAHRRSMRTPTEARKIRAKKSRKAMNAKRRRIERNR